MDRATTLKHPIVREIIQARVVKDYTVELVFDDLKKGRVDLKKFMGRGVFRDLLKKEKFKQLRVDAELGTICWPNGADIAPETLYREAVQ